VKELVTRTIAGAIFIAIVIASILFSKFSFLLLFTVIILLAQTEYLRISGKLSTISTILLSLISALTPAGTVLLANGYIGIHWMMSIPIIFIALFASILFRPGKSMSDSLGRISLFFLWSTVPLTLFLLTGNVSDTDQYNPYIPLSIIALTWVYDTFAYLTGMLIGKHKMFPALSPKKSWEGFIGGVVAAIIAAGFAGPLTGYLNPLQWMFIGLIGAVSSMLGDLIESSFKRNYSVKDSGSIIPGHGGILDRFDSLFFSAPAVYALLLIFGA